MKNPKNNPEIVNIRKIISEIISDIYDAVENQPNNDLPTTQAKNALITLSMGRVPENKIQILNGNLSGADFDEDGNTSSSGEVEIGWLFEGVQYIAVFNIQGTFYLIRGDEGKWGSSVDDSRAPEPDDHSDEEIELLDDEIIFGDNKGNEFEFNINELGDEFKRNMEKFFLQRYDPLGEKIH